MKDIEEIYKKYASYVRNYVWGLCKNPDIADDITAEVFCKAIENIDSFTGGRMQTWLCTIARNTYIDYVKKAEYKNHHLSEEMEENIEDKSGTVEELFLRKNERVSLYKQIQRLDAEMKDVVYLRIFGELSFKEIAGILGKSENWARVTFYRSKNKLKGWMENEN